MTLVESDQKLAMALHEHIGGGTSLQHAETVTKTPSKSA